MEWFVDGRTPLADTVIAILRRWYIVVLAVAVCAMGAYFLHARWPAEYSATAVLTVEPLTVTPLSGTDSTVNMDTELVVATSRDVLTKAVEQLPSQTVASLRDSVDVAVPKGSQALQFTASLPNPEAAADAANAVAKAYAQNRTDNAQNVVDQTLENLSSSIAKLEADLAKTSKTDVAYRAIQLQIDALQQRQANLAAATFYPGTLVSPAVAPSLSETPKVTVFVAGGIFLGLLIGVVIALAIARLRNEPGAASPILVERDLAA